MAEVNNNLSVTFWGTRGSIACPGPDTIRYGGNTSCLEVMCGNKRLIFDGGTGLPNLGRKIMTEPVPSELPVDLLLTHTHLDHIVGIPFFAPLHIPGNQVRLWAGHLLPNRTLKQTLSDMMAPPLFPIPPEIFQADVAFHDFEPQSPPDVGDGIKIRTAPLNHPNGATGYRVDFAGKSVCYITDTEHVPGRPDQNILDLVQDADLIIYDSTYTDEEFDRFVGFGHSTWSEGVRLADAANVGRLVVFHHDPSHNDVFMDGIAAEVEKVRPGTIVAKEGETLTL
ncbi:MBL fold metallo-hydrolase [Aestuariispira insulae]|uniref:Phosphoribosyl 1,2-cyclic phosphodiesterase n=1 Tax=Aestuariispira insulae TaxID=1461337 RepID=A0A3D9HPD9_9PROT|nr:MBL fold metallo-hydrolase [Aestuariispira insulae]RED51342.1 phosphoribosyl 1,2-cyclic phosphodiesterase [Aestuariispira insulae]